MGLQECENSMPGFKNKKPKTGFSRPQASAGIVVDREWRDVYPQDVVEGDIIAGFGVVRWTTGHADCRNQVYLEAGFPDAKEYFLDNNILVKAFVRKDN